LQDVLTEIGAPESYYFKQEQLVQLNDDISAWKDCFLNYFSLGIDIVIARETNTVKKFVFHTNFPSSHDFYRYNKANFELRPANSNSDHVINANTTWKTVKQICGDGGRPLVNRKGPFTTHFYGYPGMIFEVMKDDHLGSICWFCPTHTEL